MFTNYKKMTLCFLILSSLLLLIPLSATANSTVVPAPTPPPEKEPNYSNQTLYSESPQNTNGGYKIAFVHGGYLTVQDDLDQLINEGQLLKQGCPPSYILEAKRQRKLGTTPQHQLELGTGSILEKRKINVHPREVEANEADEIIIDVPDD